MEDDRCTRLVFLHQFFCAMEENTTQLSAVPANVMPVQPGLKPVLPPVAQRYTED